MCPATHRKNVLVFHSFLAFTPLLPSLKQMSQNEQHHGNLSFNVLWAGGCFLWSCTKRDPSKILPFFLCEPRWNPTAAITQTASGSPSPPPEGVWKPHHWYQHHKCLSSLPLGNVELFTEHMLLAFKIQRNMLKLP